MATAASEEPGAIGKLEAMVRDLNAAIAQARAGGHQVELTIDHSTSEIGLHITPAAQR